MGSLGQPVREGEGGGSRYNTCVSVLAFALESSRRWRCGFVLELVVVCVLGGCVNNQSLYLYPTAHPHASFFAPCPHMHTPHFNLQTADTMEVVEMVLVGFQCVSPS